MSIRIISTLAAVTSLIMLVGCATGEEGDEEGTTTESSEASESDEGSEMPKVETGNLDVQANGFTCACPAGQELSGGLCYPKCAAGYTGEGPVCWQVCASGFTDTGWFCQRNSKVVSANTSSCPWYNKCGLGSSCSKCPAGYKNDGCTCRVDAYIYAQPSYGRGAGSALSCN
jgi:hypothetical protein